MKALMKGSSRNVGLVLTGGGARAAFQAGAIKALADIHGPGPLPFKSLAGVSAGAINGMVLATYADDFQLGASKLWEIWSRLEVNDIFKADLRTVGYSGLRWMAGLTVGGLLEVGQSNHLLDTSPMREKLGAEIDFGAIYRHLANGTLHGVAVSATDYSSETVVTFFDGHRSIEPWTRSSRVGIRDTLTLDHVLASAAIPIFFPPIAIGSSYYGDGAVRLSTPISPVIHMGAESVLAIGIRHMRPTRTELYPWTPSEPEAVSMADIVGVILNSLFIDTLDKDIERMQRINLTVSHIAEEKRAKVAPLLRRIPLTVVQPSIDLGTIACEQFHRFPRTIRHLLKGMGASHLRSWDLLSYLAFDRVYTKILLELGYSETCKRASEIEELVGSPKVAA